MPEGKLICRKCGKSNEILERVGFRDTCSSCDSWLHSCVHCAFWSGSYCTEPSAEKVGDPEAQNYCEWYSPSTGGETRSVEEGQRRAEAEELWRKLTKKKE